MANGFVGSNGSNGTDQKVRQRRSSPHCPEKNNGGVSTNSISTLDPVGAYQSRSRYRNGRDGRSRVKGSSSSRRSSLFIGISVVIIGIILSLVVIAAVARHFSSTSSSSSGGGKCTENHHISGISGNLYTWCYKNKIENYNQGRILTDEKSGSTTRSSGVERVIRDKSGNDVSGAPKKILAAIDAHEYLHGGIVNEDQDEVCYADLTRLGYIAPGDHQGYSQPVIGPCHYDDVLTTRPKRGYNEEIDFTFFRDADEIKFTDKIRCMLECVDRVLVGRDKGPSTNENSLRENKEYPIERSMEELQPKDKVAVDDVMLIEAAKAGMLLVAEKLMVQHGLDPLYRPVQNEPGSSRSLNAIQEAIRGGYAEIVKVLTNGDNSMIIDEYDRSVEDYVKMKGSPIRPYDARNVLGIEVVEESASSQQRGKHRDSHHGNKSGKRSGWSETSVTSFDHDRCDFDVIDGDLSAEVFYRDYFITGRPVAMRGQADEMELDMFSKNSWEKLNKFNPNELFEVGPTAYPPLSEQELCSEDMSIIDMEKGAVCEEMPEKKMIHALHPHQSDLEELYPDYDGDILDPRGGFRTIKNWFPLVENREDLTWQVFFGGDASGATYHWHEAAFNILYVGTKQWKIGPPLYKGITENADKCEERLIPTLDLDSMSDEEKMDAFHEWILDVYKTFPPNTASHYRFGAAGHGNEVYDTFSSTQTSWLVDPEGEMVVKEIFYLEDLSKDITKLAEHIPCLKSGPLEMDHSNKTPNYPNYMLFAKNEQTRSIINEVFADDFKNLEYSPL
ncbi:hypothetical protein FRACYDRAFT_248612 [Fragilariopsis cylindrus CCMP1102]|uniref:JmjC domain-containing protein n=1 Tax=Fragilariopsis cylindrus CCMP1102 TaxID=635003 RepID=A0A1E7ETZ9_9STRA|nr:hypothetical protein FRACYDRAFT_248612 [Fragilariopsis cylindrus CCMP1102]|eukprot:OEU09275.1 hypothetical protein FRACYDRAFT_248612 [Fragilariopsis cylindrus CCMP1102]